MNPAGRLPSYLAFLLLISLLSACGGGNSSVSSRSTITSVSVTPADVTVNDGAVQQYSATVNGTGSYDHSVVWEVNGTAGGALSTGTIDTSGNYIAPSGLSAATNFTVTAKSKQDPTKSGNAVASVPAQRIILNLGGPLAAAPGSSVNFVAYAPLGGSPLTNLSWSVESVVGGNASVGTISTAGVYTAPLALPGKTTFTISASSNSTPNEWGSTTILVDPSDTIAITNISPASGSVGDAISIGYIAPNAGWASVYFVGAGGEVISAPTASNSSGLVTAIVPMGAVTGPVVLRATATDGAAMQSPSASFMRLPNLIVNSDRSAVSSGENLRMQFALLGASSSRAVSWIASQGTIAGNGLFTAPTVATQTFVKVKGCQNGTTSCDSTLIEVDPFRILPDAPRVGLGQTLALSAETAGTPVTATWKLLSGGGTLTSSGVYTAPTDGRSSGGVNVSATVGGVTETATIAVTGYVPGLINRVEALADFSGTTPGSGTPPPGRIAGAITAINNRAFVLFYQAIPESNAVGETYMVTYDTTDPADPRWLGAVELPFPAFALHHYRNWIFAQANGNLAVYDASSGFPVFQGYYDLHSELDFGGLSLPFANGLFYGIRASGQVATSGAQIDVFDFRSGTLSETSYAITDSSLIPQITMIISLAGDGASQIALTLAGGGNLETLIFDLSGTAPEKVSSLTNFNCLGLFNGLLFTYQGVYDVSTPAAKLLIRTDLSQVMDVEPDGVLARGGQGSMEVYRSSTPGTVSNPVSLLAADSTGALAGKYIYTGDDMLGLGVWDVSVAGGLHAIHANYVDGTPIWVMGQAIQGNYLYDGGAWPGAPVIGGFDVRDLSQPIPTLVGILQEPYQVNAIQVSGNYAYLGEYGQLSVVDISNPASPRDVATASLPAFALALKGTTLYAGTIDNHLVVVDISIPTSPKVGQSIALPDTPMSMHIQGNTLFLADSNGGLLSYNIAIPTAPQLLSAFNPPGAVPTNDVSLDGSMAFLAAGANGLAVVNVANPAQPAMVSSIGLDSRQAVLYPPAYATAVLAQNNIAYVGTMDTSCAIEGFDYSDPSKLRPVYFDLNGTETGLLEDPIPVTSLVGYGSSIFAGCEFAAYSVGWVQFDATQPRNVQSLFPYPLALRYYKSFVPSSTRKSRFAKLRPWRR